MFERVSVPTPFQVGPVNAYVAGRTIVDPGPDSEEAWSELLAALEARELAPADVRQVVVTHPHPDHFGLAKRFREAGASVIASPVAAEIMADFPAHLEYEQSFFREFFERCGMAAETAQTVTSLPEAFITYAPSVTTDREVTTGDTLTVDDRRVDVDEVSGHAASELLFAYDGESGREAVVGDHVLGEITPNPFLQPPREDGGERPRVLPAYNESLERLREAGYDRFRPGHRGDVTDPAGRIDAILAEHRERTETVAELVTDPITPVEVMEELFGELPATEQFPGMSEAVGHLDVLAANGRAEARDRGGLLVYEATE